MNRKWIGALVFGAAAGAANFGFLEGLENEASGGERVLVLVASKDLAKSELLAPDKLSSKTIPSAFLDGREIEASKAKEIDSLPMAVAIGKGQKLLWSDVIADRGETGSDLAELVDPGKRAIAISVDSSLSLSGMLKPGHRVDILGTFNKGRFSEKDRVTVTLLQNVMVLATGNRIAGASPKEEEENKERFDTVTLSVGLEESELLVFAASHGRLSLVLRGRQDLEVVRDVPEKGMNDVWEAERRNALQQDTDNSPRIERLKVRQR